MTWPSYIGTVMAGNVVALFVAFDWKPTPELRREIQREAAAFNKRQGFQP